MPELPDVGVLRRYLQSTALHQEIDSITIRAESLIPSEGPAEMSSADKLKREVLGHSFVSTRRHGKWLFANLDGRNEQSFVFHFGMTSGLKYFKDQDDEPEYTKADFRFANGYHLAYHSQRKLGVLAVIDSIEDFIKAKDLGLDALDLGLDQFKNLVEGRRMIAKSLLMDQSTLAGIDNVYSDEILFQAGIHPRTKVNELDEDTLEHLFYTMQEVLNEAIGVASHFIADGVVLLRKDAQGEVTEETVQEDVDAVEIPLVTLVNGGTASGAEVVFLILDADQQFWHSLILFLLMVGAPSQL